MMSFCSVGNLGLSGMPHVNSGKIWRIESRTISGSSAPTNLDETTTEYPSSTPVISVCACLGQNVTFKEVDRRTLTSAVKTGVNMEVRVCAVIPVLNEEKFISRCIDSLLKQTMPVDILVMEGGSDSTLDILKSYGDSIKVVKTRKVCFKCKKFSAGLHR